jgi:hypothetical protein
MEVHGIIQITALARAIRIEKKRIEKKRSEQIRKARAG